MNDSQKGGARLMKSEHKRRELAPLLAIFGILVGLALASLLTPEREFSPNENRYLQLKPSLTWTTLMDGTFTQKAEDYVADQIALRDRWMEASSLVQRAALRLEINDTWLGRDGRYFAKVTPDTFDTAQYEKNLAQVKDFFDANPDKDCRMMMVPTPAYMLRDDLPANAPLFDAVSIYSEAGYLVSVRVTSRRGEATELAEELGAEFDLVVCHGGDGTLNETVNGVMRIPKEKRPAVSYLPGGSTNDFAASLNISSDPAKAARSAMRLQPRELDVGKFGERNFVYVASFGAFTKTTYTVPQDIKNVFGHFAYMLDGVKNLDTLCPYRMKITADGEVFDGEYLFGAISNSTSIAGLMKLSPETVSFDDGEFELLLVPVPRTPAAMQALILALINKDYCNSEGLIFRHVKHVTAETAEDIPWTLDGEYDPGAPLVEIGIEENGLTMMI